MNLVDNSGVLSYPLLSSCISREISLYCQSVLFIAAPIKCERQANNRAVAPHVQNQFDDDDDEEDNDQYNRDNDNENYCNKLRELH